MGEPSHPNEPRPDLTADDHPAAVLRSLEHDRGTIFTEQEYQEMRRAIIEELARGPQRRFSVFFTFAVVGLLLFALTVIGLALALQGVVQDYTLAVAGLCALGAWGYVLRGLVTSWRREARRSIQQRLEELEELRAANLITRAEYDHIYAAIHMSRAAPGQSHR